MTYEEEIEYAKKLLKEALASIEVEIDDEDMVTEDGREAVFVAHAIMKTAMQAQREACAEVGYAESFNINVPHQQRIELKQAILNAEVQP